MNVCINNNSPYKKFMKLPIYLNKMSKIRIFAGNNETAVYENSSR